MIKILLINIFYCNNDEIFFCFSVVFLILFMIILYKLNKFKYVMNNKKLKYQNQLICNKYFIINLFIKIILNKIVLLKIHLLQ